jgi:hypothetical protein
MSLFESSLDLAIIILAESELVRLWEPCCKDYTFL